MIFGWNVPENEKDKQWIERIGRSIREHVDNNNLDANRDQFCYNMWNGQWKEQDYDYLRKMGEYEFPARVRFYPLLRPKFDQLLSEYVSRPFPYRVLTFDKDSIKRKIDHQTTAILDSIRAKVFDRFNNIQMAEQQVQAALQQQQQQQPPDPQGGIAPGAQEQQVMGPEEARQFEIFGQELRRHGVLTEDELKKIDEYYTYEHRELLEHYAQKAGEYLFFSQSLQQVFKNGFISKIITDKPVYFVDWDDPNGDPFIENINETQFYYADDNDIEWIQHAEWGMMEKFISAGRAIDKYRWELKEEDIHKLKLKSGYGHSNSQSSYTNYDNYSNYNGVYQPLYDNSYMIKESVVFFKSPRRVIWKETPNKYLPGSKHRHIVDETEVPSQRPKSDDTEYKEFYVNDIYEVVLLDSIVVRARKKPVQLRGVDKYGEVDLPFVGKAYNSKNRRPYSLMWAAKDIQILWNLVHYHKELWIALSGVKGFIMDRSQKPRNMSDEEWLYQKRMGVGWIETQRDGKQTSTFNQFKTYDDTITQGVVYLIEVIRHLDDMASKVVGMSEARMGHVQPSDQVGTYQSSIRQSNLTTEIIYYDHDEIKAKALERAINLCRLAWKDGKIGAYAVGELGQQILNVPAGSFQDTEFKIFFKHAGDELAALQELKQLATQKAVSGDQAFGIPELAELYQTKSLTDLKAKTEKMKQEAMELAQQQIQAQVAGEQENLQLKAQLDAQVEETKARLAGEIDMAVENLKQQGEQMRMGLEEKRFEFDKFKFEQEQTLEQAKLQVEQQDNILDHKAKLADTESERVTEMAYLDKEREEMYINQELEEKSLSVQEKLGKLQARMKAASVDKPGSGKEKIKN